MTDAYSHWIHPAYEIRVRGTVFLWGSAGVSKNITFDKPLHFHIKNDVLGTAITFGTRLASGAQTAIGTLEPGECVSIPVQDISGVFADCASESMVCCIIRD